MRRVPVSVMVRSEGKELLRQLADAADMSMSTYVRVLINEALRARGITPRTVSTFIRRAAA
jgi:hypothetical protein